MSKNLVTVLNLFKKRKSLTDLEIQGLTTLNPNSVRPCRLALLQNGAIQKTNEKRCGYTVYRFVKDYNKQKNKVTKTQIINSLRSCKKQLKRLMDNIKDILTNMS